MQRKPAIVEGFDYLTHTGGCNTVGRNSVSHRDTLLAVFARLNG